MLELNKKCCLSQLQKIFQNLLYSFQRALSRLEKGGIIVSYKEGKTLLYQFNPRYPFLLELEAFLKKNDMFIGKSEVAKHIKRMLSSCDLSSSFHKLFYMRHLGPFYSLHGYHLSLPRIECMN